MSQKLIRLTCESNDGIFNGKFDQDIEIKQGSDIAFQSLTLERASDALIVNNANRFFTFSSTGFPPEDQFTSITKGKYEQADLDALMSDITNAMNSLCSMTAINSFGQNKNEMNLQWRASIDEYQDKSVIECKRSPFFPISQWNVSEAVYNTGFIRNSPILNGITDAAKVNQTTERGLGRDTAGANGVLNESYTYSSIPFIKSTGALRVRLGAMFEGSNDRPAATIALVDRDGLTKLRNSTITIEDLVYAIRVDEPTSIATTGGYSSLHAKGSTTFTPFTVGGNLVKPENFAEDNPDDTNDMFEIRIDKNKIVGSIFQDTVAISDLPDATGITEGGDLYPVIFFHMDINTVALDMCQVSLDPFGNLDDAPNQIIKDNPYAEPLTSELTGHVEFYIDNLKIPTTPQVNLDKTIATYLGFTNPTLVDFADVDTFISKGGVLSKQVLSNLEISPDGGDGTYTFEVSFRITSPNVVSNAIDGDSYLVDTQTFQLDSFDSYGLSSLERFANSGGSRRNLLAVIPVVEQDIVNSPNTRIQYEPNTLDYIAIKNKSDIITRQIKMRLLNSRYDNVVTSGMAAMTVLIREPSKKD